MSTQASADIGLTGLAVMGRNLARNMARHGHTVAVHNRTTEKMTGLLDEHGDDGEFVGSESMEDFVASIKKPRAIVIMVKAGEATDAVIDELVPLLDEGDIVVDAGNAHFEDTLRRQAALEEKGLHFVGMGVSGGEEGALERPLDHGRRLRPRLRAPGPDRRGHRRPGRRHPLRHPRRTRRRRPLREDGAQRHRVRRHAADRGGLRRAAQRAGPEPAELAEVFRSGTRATWSRS